MAKIFKEEQRFHEPLSKVLLVILALAAVYNLIEQYLNKGWNESTNYTVMGLLALAAIYFGVRYMRMRIKIGRNKFRIQVRPLPWSYREIHREEVECIQFFRMSEAALSGGWAVSFNPDTKIFNFGDRSGMVLLLKNGEEIRVFSRNLYRQSDALAEQMKELGWPVE